MARITIILLGIYLSLSLSAQSQYDFAPVGAEWTFNNHRFIQDEPITCNSDPCDLSWVTMRVTDKEIIDGLTFSNISFVDQSSGATSPSEINFHQQGDSIFFLYEDTLRLIYDFSAQVGDVIQIYVPNFIEGSGPTTNILDDYPPIIPMTMEVVFEDSVSVNGNMRRMVSYRDYSSSIEMRNIIDGIGSTIGLFGPSLYLVSEGCGGFFWCYSDPEESYIPFGCCAIPSGPNAISEDEISDINIYPNPASDVLYIESSNLSEKTKYSILSLTGAILKSGNLKNGAIDIRDLSSGVLILELNDNTLSRFSKFIKE